jgi:hypothetical protein
MIIFRLLWLFDPRVWREVIARYRAWCAKERERNESDSDDQWIDRQPPM